MPLTLQMSDIRLRCQRRADMETDGFIGTSEWNAMISEVYGELWAIVISSGMMYFQTLTTITTTGALSYQEPSDMFDTVGVCRVLNTTTGQRQDLVEAMIQERSKLSGRTGDANRYLTIDDQLYLLPTPPAGQTYEWLYVPQPTDLSTYADSSYVDLVTADGLKFLLNGVAAIAKAKSESDVSFLVSEREAARERFTTETKDRALDTPRRRQFIGGDNWSDAYDADWAGDDADWSNR